MLFHSLLKVFPYLLLAYSFCCFLVLHNCCFLLCRNWFSFRYHFLFLFLLFLLLFFLLFFLFLILCFCICGLHILLLHLFVRLALSRRLRNRLRSTFDRSSIFRFFMRDLLILHFILNFGFYFLFLLNRGIWLLNFLFNKFLL